ncbi:hypothetical protein SCAB_24002 [Streptomyces scabiei 87.22]|uniref:Uncharacterized protein n=1 Tax=Streptomyces scabiei (strain 87.22) TaxID=680198 RepID=C9Z0G2_STRSW|nr:hypothetical protein SCAB_24002 [Streptomyces scabiei 87.22]
MKGPYSPVEYGPFVVPAALGPGARQGCVKERLRRVSRPLCRDYWP